VTAAPSFAVEPAVAALVEPAAASFVVEFAVAVVVSEVELAALSSEVEPAVAALVESAAPSFVVEPVVAVVASAVEPAVYSVDLIFVLELQKFYVLPVSRFSNFPPWMERVSVRWRPFFVHAVCISATDYCSISHQACCFL